MLTLLRQGRARVGEARPASVVGRWALRPVVGLEALAMGVLASVALRAGAELSVSRAAASFSASGKDANTCANE